MTNDNAKRWLLTNYNYIKQNMFELSKEARLLFSDTKFVKYQTSAVVTASNRVYYAPACVIDYQAILEEITRTNFVGKHSQQKETFAACPLFIYFCIGQVLFDRLIELLEERGEGQLFYSIHVRCFYRYMMIYLQAHFEHITFYENEKGEIDKAFNMPVILPVVHINRFAPIVDIVVNPNSKESATVHNKPNKEIEFDSKCLHAYMYTEANPIAH